MRLAVGLTNLLMGGVYVTYGVIAAIEMKRGWKTLGFTHFGAAFFAMAFTCGPHHLAHGIHALFEGRPGGGLDLASVLFGLPAGAIWFYLRIEAFKGGRGDRFVAGTPAWLRSLPTVWTVFVAAFAIVAVTTLGGGSKLTSLVAPNILLVVLYLMIGYFLMRTQLRNRPSLGGWSMSGLSLAMVFPTCALMHVAYIVHSTTGLYHYDLHGFTIDWIGVPAALYFLLVVRGLYRESLRDWNTKVVGAPPLPALVK